MKNLVDHPVQELFARRWSPYVYDPVRGVSSEDLRSLFEAARWTMSSFNEQPWRYIVGIRDREQDTWDRICGLLMEGNQAWAQHAPVLALGLAKLNFEYNGRPNRSALHDLGAASASLSLEAAARGIAVHQMAGFHRDRVADQFDLPDSIEAVTALAIGYPGDAEQGEGDFAKRDRRVRKRRSVEEFILHGGL
jgi:nitroreductase